MENKLNIEIKKAVPEDAEAWCRIRKACWLLVYPNKDYDITREDILLKDFDSPKKLKNWRESFQFNNDFEYLSAKQNGRAIGLCIAQKRDEENEICAIYIDPKFWRQGVGRMLLDKAFSKLNNNKKTKLNVVSYNENAINFYKTFGFKITGPVDDDHGKLPNGKKLPQIEMVR